MPTKFRPDDIVDIDTYPIHDPGNPARAELIASCRKSLDADMYCVIPNFVRREALRALTQEAKDLRPLANDNNSNRNVYLQRQKDTSLPEDHARNIFHPASVRMISYDLIPENSPLKTFYHWNMVRDTVAEIVGDVPLYDNADPCQPVNYACYEEGDQSSWHYDSVNAFTMTLMIQAADEGGLFQMSPNTRTDDDENYGHVQQVLRGERDDTIVDVAREPGALCIFRGCNSLHRVSPVKGNTMRIMGVFVYEKEPGVVGDPEVNETVYGRRVAAAE